MGAALKYADVLAKGQPSGPTSVHVGTALSNQDNKRRFHAFLGQKVDDAAQVLDQQATVKGAGAARTLKPLDAETAHTPFPYDAQALDKLRPDQVPRFFGALTDPQRLDVKTVSHGSLTAMQNRVDPKKVEAMRGGKAGGKKAVVVRNDGRNYIADGHHRLAADHLDGKDSSEVHYIDLTPLSNALKRDTTSRGASWSLPFTVTKTDADKKQVFGFASVVTKNDMIVVDKQGDVIPVHELENAVYTYVLEARANDDMHLESRANTGRAIESMVFTKEKCEKLGIQLPVVDPATGDRGEAWWVGYQIDDAQLWAAYRRGDRPEFSIGGAAVGVEV